MIRIRCIIAGVAAASLIGCQGPEPVGSPTTAASAASASADASSVAKVWADNCSRCHYIRPPDSYSDSQWETVVHHMRLRANLTGGEQRAVTEFLKAAH